MEREVVCWNEDKDPEQPLAEVRPKVAQIAGDEMSAMGFDSCQEDGDIFFG